MLIAGVDEVGRGALAGPVVAAAVILDNDIDGLNDSKKLTEKKRNVLFKIINDHALSIAVGIKWNDYIDDVNIKVASEHAMIDAINNLSHQPDKVLVDGFPLDIPIKNEGIIRGDQKIRSIMAASIIAKVTRDEIMRSFHYIYPMYGFDKNKGYGTKQHCNALKEYSYISIHRETFKPISSMISK
ncbi:MAG: ribonuclease HII [bacterium]|jgi:ribonuclease HII|nr:ribonuclease HII [Candidatus Neomarinimicrobiota bacterium]HIL86485.1 ribonuclease HII [Candidatus Neomarinimicrobiota bacterium]